MAIDGESLKEASFWDDETQSMVKITLKVKDIVYFRLLQKLEAAIKGLNK